MAYEPTSEEGKAALAAGADPAVVEEMEKEGTLPPVEKSKEGEEGAEHVDTGKEGKDDEGKDKTGTEGDDAGKGKAGEGEGEDGKGDEGDGDDKDRQPNRTVQSMPAWKAKELAKKEADEREAKVRAELTSEFEKKLADAGGKTGAEKDEEIDKIASEFNLTPEVASALVDRMSGVVSKKLGLDEIRKGHDEQQERARAQKEEEGFNAEWSEKSTQDALKAAAGSREITVDVQKKVKELAYDERYARYRLTDIIRLESSNIFGDEKKEVKSAERGRGGSGRGTPQKEIDEMSPEDIDSMSDDEFLKFSNDLGKSGSRFVKSTKKR